MSPAFRILYVEDSPQDAELALGHFRQHAPDFELEIAATGQACLERLPALAYDAVLLDQRLPDMDGLDVLKALVHAGVTVPVVLATGMGDEELVVKALRLGAANYVPKVDAYLETLPDLLRGVIADHRRRRLDGRIAAGVRRVLYVEHDRMDVDLTLRHFAEAAPHLEVEVVTTCADALARLGQPHAYDAALIDLRMPDQTGLEFVREARRLRLRVPPFVMLSGRGDDAAAIASLRLGATDYIAKRPGYLDQLAHTIDHAIDRHRLERLAEQLRAELAERGRAEEALRKSEAWHRVLFEGSRDALMTLAPPSWHFSAGNPAAIAMFGARDAADFVARAPWHYSPERQPGGGASAAAGLALIEAAMREGSRSFEWVFKRDSGAEFPATVLLTRVEIDGQPLLQATVRDDTEKRALQASVAQSERLASMGLLAAGVAHEINNPLTYVLFNAERLAQTLPPLAGAARRCGAALRERLGDAGFAALAGDGAEALLPASLDETVELAREAVEGARRIKQLSRCLGTFSHVDDGELALVDLTGPIESAATMAHNEIKFRARLIKDLGAVPAVLAAPGRLSQVFLNLLINAAHAIDEGHPEQNRIVIRSWAEGAHVFAAVSDTGRGIPAENLTRVFEPFFTTKKVGEGTGLGLAICKNILAEFGGDIRVESEVGKGTRFVVRLPVGAAEPAAGRDRARPGPAPAPAVRGRVLVVDDEPSIRAGLMRLLGHDHDVVAAASGEEGRALLERDSAFDVVLCDLMMPEVSGPDLHAWLAARDPALAGRMVFITGGAFTPRATAFLAAVENPRIEKPFDAASLQQLVATLSAAAKRGK